MFANAHRSTMAFSVMAFAFTLVSTLSVEAYSQDYPVIQMLKRNATSFAIDGNHGGDDGQDVYLWTENENSVNQQWYEIDRGNGYYSFQKVGTNYCLDGGNNGGDGQNVYLWSCVANNQNQHWLKVNVSGDYYRLEKRNAPGYSLDGNRGGVNGQSVYLWSSNNSNQNQHWLFNYVGEAGGVDCNVSWSGSDISISNETVNQTLEAVDISCADDVTIEMNIQGSGSMENADYINISYRVDGGAPQALFSETNAFGQTTATASGISGNTLEIIVDGFTSYADEVYTISNVRVFNGENGGTTVEGNSPYRNNTTFVGGGGYVSGALQHSCDTPSGYTIVNSLSAMRNAMSQSNVKVALAPGLYAIDDADTNIFTTMTLPGDEDGRILFPVTGSNSEYDFRCAKVEFNTNLWEVFGRANVIQLWTVGNNNKVYNLTIEDIGNTDPQGGALNIMMDGRDNLLDGAVITARGSEPYGLGDAYGKGGGSVLWHRKHSVALIRGLRSTVKQSTFYNYAYGHTVFMQASDDTLIDGIYVQGELRSTADMLASNNARFADSDARAAGVDYITEWGYKLPTGYWMSLQEEGIRAYNGGITVVDGVESTGAADTVTVLNSVVRHHRGGVTLVHANGDKYVENTTVIGNEGGFSIGSGDIVNCYADASVGAVLGFAYSSDSGTHADITVLSTDGSKNGSGVLAYIGGRNHNITLRSDGSALDPNLEIRVSGDKEDIRMLNGNLDYQNNLDATNIEFDNFTNYPVVLGSGASDVSGESDGPVSGNTGENSIR